MPDVTTVPGAITLIGGLLLALGIIWALGWELVELLGPSLYPSRSVKAVASLLCGVILCGFVVMVPAKLAPNEAAFRLVIQWLVPIFVIAMAPIVVVRRARRGRPWLRPASWAVRGFRPWLSSLVLALVTIVVLIHSPITHPTIELSAARESDTIQIDISFTGSDGSPYVLTANGADLGAPIVYKFVAPASGTIAFSVPARRGLAINLANPQGQVLRALYLP
jgi:hypothetical protein